MTMQDFYTRLEQVPKRLSSKNFLDSTHIGKEIGFYIFDYPPEKELTLRSWLNVLPDQVNKHSERKLEIVSLNIFEEIVNYIKKRKYYEKIVKLQKERGNDVIQKGLTSFLDSSSLSKMFSEIFSRGSYDIIFMHGVGSAWPMIRIHSLLNILQPIVGQKPLVLFYPGTFTSTGLTLFDRLPSDNYYRAFRLLP